MLLPSDYDHAASRVGLFRMLPYCRADQSPLPAAMVQRRRAPKTNFCWHVWDWRQHQHADRHL